MFTFISNVTTIIKYEKWLLSLTKTFHSFINIELLAFNPKHWKAEMVSHISGPVLNLKPISLCPFGVWEAFIFVCMIQSVCEWICAHWLVVIPHIYVCMCVHTTKRVTLQKTLRPIATKQCPDKQWYRKLLGIVWLDKKMIHEQTVITTWPQNRWLLIRPLWGGRGMALVLN